ncbi:MAG: hypothetical protein KDK36_07970, partial [Leptospiraceae bacterium]|nr:hypothetical protein [Leptospiraceae bacterium]
MKRIISVLSLLIFFLFINCGPKKKKASLFPFLTVINEERTSNLDDKFELPLAPSKYLNSENNLFVIKPSSNNKFTILPENI